ncbi:MAG: polymerase III, delta prime subunit protein [Candidatus Nomurabacteria bacterium GW2011_GWA1_46_11]|uniref:Polymerase III, delta prime subunit protein n=1 Tax=Candidatus Nomurabacteria bacterium GW2011_GWA1_46_11 TaxID=1618732 RepID=A0A0G1RHW1_9BACT|nr:MAG: polymerase III, delta prime subunit protein [Microgenomates group bacterium GW2011_GWB1_44_8]KKU20530.1 MAG: polymerase III, delta prime subunit protein [Candidatus Nomurabacteria bacterium GW2011_GWA1_46_11]
MHAFLTTVNPELVEGLDTLHIIPDKSIGIDEIRQIQFFLSRKPTQSDHNTIVIHSAHLLTLPAQHALLKTLEEPPGNSLIYLITSTPDSLLPTILSRVQLIKQAFIKDFSTSITLQKSKELFVKLQKVGVGERLKILEDQEFTRESALSLLDDLEYILHQQISSGLLSTINYELITSTRRYLKANCNLKLCLSHLAINL